MYMCEWAYGQRRWGALFLECTAAGTWLQDMCGSVGVWYACVCLCVCVWVSLCMYACMCNFIKSTPFPYGRLDKDALSLLEMLLQYQSHNRVPAVTAMRHVYFQSLGEAIHDLPGSELPWRPPPCTQLMSAYSCPLYSLSVNSNIHIYFTGVQTSS